MGGDAERERMQAHLNERKEKIKVDQVLEETQEAQAHLASQAKQSKKASKQSLNKKLASQGARKATDKKKGSNKQSNVSQKHKKKFVMDENTNATSRMKPKSKRAGSTALPDVGATDY